MMAPLGQPVHTTPSHECKTSQASQQRFDESGQAWARTRYKVRSGQRFAGGMPRIMKPGWKTISFTTAFAFCVVFSIGGYTSSLFPINYSCRCFVGKRSGGISCWLEGDGGGGHSTAGRQREEASSWKQLSCREAEQLGRGLRQQLDISRSARLLKNYKAREFNSPTLR